MTAEVVPGAEPFSHVAGSPVGVLVSHGFTGTPFSVLGLGRALTAAGFDVELPRLPGHGTSIDDMLTTAWPDWRGAVEVAYQALAARCDQIVLVGQSMGGTLVLATALAHSPEAGGRVAGVVGINPLVKRRAQEDLDAIAELLDDGVRIAPGGPSDIADPAAADLGYRDTPLAPLRSLLLDGVAAIDTRYGELAMPLRLFTSRQDHVVSPDNSEYLAERWGGPVEHTWLDRSYHVATLDYDRALVEAGTVEFVTRLTASVA